MFRPSCHTTLYNISRASGLISFKLDCEGSVSGCLLNACISLSVWRCSDQVFTQYCMISQESLGQFPYFLTFLTCTDPVIVTDRVKDLIILMAKRYIYSCRFDQILPRIHIFLTKLKSRYHIEEYNAKLQNDLIRFKTVSYKSLFFMNEWVSTDRQNLFCFHTEFLT